MYTVGVVFYASRKVPYIHPLGMCSSRLEASAITSQCCTPLSCQLRSEIAVVFVTASAGR